MPRYGKRTSESDYRQGFDSYWRTKDGKTTVSLINYDGENFNEKELPSIEETYQHKDSHPVTWININGLHGIDIIEKIDQQLGLD